MVMKSKAEGIKGGVKIIVTGYKPTSSYSKVIEPFATRNANSFARMTAPFGTKSIRVIKSKRDDTRTGNYIVSYKVKYLKK